MKGVKRLKISISGVRGVIGDSLTPGLLVRFAESFGTYLSGGTVVVGRDTRTSGEMVQHAVLSGLMATGCKVVFLDICPVPTIQMAVRRLRADGGIAITASHNPVEWNALKFIRGDGCFLNHYEARELLDIYHQGDYIKAKGRDFLFPEHYKKAVRDHINAIMEKVGPLPETGGGRKIKVVVDCVNGAGSVMSAKLLGKLGCKVRAINKRPDGIFSRPPEPLPENLSMLCEAVKKYGADIGFAQDADADRLAVVSEKGEPIGEEYTLAIAVDSVLERTPGPVVVNLATTRAVEDIAAARGCKVFKSKIGEINVTETMAEKGAVIGGEGNGGVIYPGVNFARDSFTGMALILHRLVSSGGSLSELVSGLPRYTMVKATVPCPSHRVQDVIEGLIERHASEKLDLTEGIRIISGKKWSLIRPSNTEPILRVMSEAPNEAQARNMNGLLAAEVKELLGDE